MIMNRILSIIFILFLVGLHFGYALDAESQIVETNIVEDETTLLYESLHQYRTLQILQNISGQIGINNSDRDTLRLIQAKLQLYPKQTPRQQILSENIQPFAVTTNNSQLLYSYTPPFTSPLKFSHGSLIQTQNIMVPITQKVSYPLEKIPLEYEQYMVFTDLINSNPEIEQKAFELASDSDDAYEIAHTVAFWVRNSIEYNLSSLIVEASNPATRVFETRQGVCDELTTLYISMMRLLGYPARYVSGFAYTTSDLFEEPWVAHAWAEVYIPSAGWVPFDLTYGQFGFVDATHISFTTGVDGGNTGTIYNWETTTQNQVMLDISRLKFTHNVRQTGEELISPYNISMRVLYDSISPKSQNAVIITIQNTQTYYRSILLRANAPKELIFSQEEYAILLRPFETTSVVLPFSVIGQIQEGFLYTMPIQLYDGFFQYEESLEVSTTSPIYTKSDVANAIIAADVVDSQNIFEDVFISCSPNKYELRIEEESYIECQIQNERIYRIAMKICAQNNCESVAIQAVDKKTIQLPVEFDSVGLQFVLLELHFEDVVVDSAVQFYIIDTPKISIPNFDKNVQVSFGSSEKLWFILSKDSFSPAQNIRLQAGQILPTFVSLGTIHSNQNLSISINPYQLRPGFNDYPIHVWYKDDLGKTYSFTQKISVELVEVNFFDKIRLFFAQLFL